MLTITVSTAPGYSLQDVCEALAEGEHCLGDDATYAGYMLAHAWAGKDCPWSVPHPDHCGHLAPTYFYGFDVDR